MIPSNLLNITTQIDCLEGMSYLPDESIDLCLSDPPYNIGLKYKDYDDKLTEKEYWLWMRNIFIQVHRVLKDKYHLTFTCAQKQIWPFRDMLEDIGFKFRHLGVWHNPKRKAGSWPGIWPYSWEAVMDFTKGKKYRKLNNGNSVGYMDVWVEEECKGYDHPAKRPIEMWCDLVKVCSFPGDTVLDIFMGSGSTAEAVLRNGDRDYIGFDIDEYYVGMSNDRHAAIKKEIDNVDI